jgi:Domain of unknown function (DUF4932)
MTLRGLLVAAAAVFLIAGRSPAAEGTVRATVDPRVEFLSAVARNAGFEEYRSSHAQSPYAARVDALLAPNKAHPAFERMRAMRKDHGMSYDAVMSLAMHVSDPPALAERIDFDRRPGRLDPRLSTGDTRDLLRDLRDLAKQVDWAGFMERERAVRDAGASQLTAAANAHDLMGWFTVHLGVPPGADCVLVAGLLCGEQNYGVGVDFPDGQRPELRPVIGTGMWDAAGLPVYRDSPGLTALLVHELCHSFANPVVDRHLDALQPAGERLFRRSADRMRAQAYGDWKTCMYETLVRACTVRCIADLVDGKAAQARAENDVARGFVWVPALAQALAQPLAAHPAGQTLDTLVPVVAAALATEADRLDKAETNAPKLVSSEPTDGAEVAPGPFVIVLRFDRPMRRGTYSVTGAKEDVPAGLALGAVSEDARTWEFRGTAEPGRTYRIGLNGGRFDGFKADDGTPLAPRMITIRVRAQ